MSLNAYHCWGIITDNQQKVDDLYANFMLQYTPEEMRRVPDGFYIRNQFVKWLRPHGANSIRGYRFHRVWIDKDCFEQYVNGDYTILLLYCKKIRDLIWI